MSPAPDEHERNAQAFLKAFEDRLLALAPQLGTDVWSQRSKLLIDLRELLAEEQRRGRAAGIRDALEAIRRHT